MKSVKALLMVSILVIALTLSGCIGLSSGTPAPSPTMTRVVDPAGTSTSTPTPTPTPTITSTPTPKPTLDNGYADDDFYNVSISVTISRGGNISINNTGGPGLLNLYAIKISFNDRAGNTRGPDTVSNLAEYGVTGDLNPQEGSSALISSDNCGMLTHVVVIGLFRDGATKPLAEEYLQGAYNS